jgi:hypothetical protein
VAHRLFTDKGFADTSLEEAAERAGSWPVAAPTSASRSGPTSTASC